MANALNTLATQVRAQSLALEKCEREREALSKALRQVQRGAQACSGKANEHMRAVWMERQLDRIAAHARLALGAE